MIYIYLYSLLVYYIGIYNSVISDLNNIIIMEEIARHMCHEEDEDGQQKRKRSFIKENTK